MEDEKPVTLPENDEEFFKIAELRLKMMEQDYEKTLAAGKLNNELQFKGKFEQSEFNNVKFENSQNQQNENEEQQTKNYEDKDIIDSNNLEKQDDEEDNDIKHEDYQQLSDDSNTEEKQEEEEWGDMQTAEINKEEKKNNSSITIDAEKIKNMMAKIQIKPPEWATSPDIWKLKLTQMCKDLNS